MARKRGRGRELRVLAAAFTVAAPSGARIRDRLRLEPADEKVLRLVGEHLGRQQRADLAERVRIGQVTAKDTQRGSRKKKLTAVSSSRWAGAMTRASEDQYQLSMRCLYDERAGLRRAIHAITRRLTAPCGPAATRDGRLRTAISQLIALARQHGCAGIAIEDLGFAEARATGRETMGRGRRGNTFRRTVAGIPTARFRERLRGMAHHQGMVVIAADLPTPAAGAPGTGPSP
ncbi:hypothetical protein ABT009_12735 [Streptomyces sp. NPDC002896]|uniref:hypothetical protein n=1 Tax=Streptomyces sp. NPDC002896 TaxID=3154438 RepID=UPI00332D30D5